MDDLQPKYGFVALLDALGTKTASIKSAQRYLDNINEIESGIQYALKATVVPDALKNPKLDPEIFSEISTRFFGDTILITYEIKDRKQELEYFTRITFILQLFICNALETGLLFRGSVSIGEYIDKEAVVLGPAVSDAANWYEQLDMIGVVFTPQATIAATSIVESYNNPLRWRKNTGTTAVLVRPPLKDTKVSDIELFLVNWVESIILFCKSESPQEWFYRVIRQFSIPWGVESKFVNTVRFFERHVTNQTEKETKSRPAGEKLQTGKGPPP
jgi:hypothetical protein